MPIDSDAYTERGRAESFGSVAADYDRYRASYPDALIADLANLNPGRALDVACGTGKVAVALLACGIAILGVEIDAKMAAVARSHAIIVEVDAFETWDDDGRTFDLITCGQAWHWIDPAKGAPKAARLLRPGRTLAVFWNHPELDEHLQRDLDRVYEQHAPDLVRTKPPDRVQDSEHLAGLKATRSFARIQTENYRWDETLTADEWIGRLSTHSDHVRLPAEQRSRLLEAVRAVIDRHGGVVSSQSRTFTIFAHN